MTTTEQAEWVGPCGCPGCEKWADCYYCDGCSGGLCRECGEAEGEHDRCCSENEPYDNSDEYRDYLAGF